MDNKITRFGLAAIFFTLFLGLPIARAANVSTTVVTTESVITLTQSDYRWYENVNALTPTTGLASENTAATTPVAGTVIRLRMNIKDTGVELSAGAQFKLQFSNSTSSGFADVATSTSWIFSDNAGVADGQTIVTTVLASSTVPESYSESNPSATTPNAIGLNQKGEWDWVLKNNSASTDSNWFFRMIYSSSTVLNAYDNFPSLSAAAVTPPPSTGGGGSFQIGPQPTQKLKPSLEPLVPPSPCDEPSVQRADLNGDCLIDIVDLSILLFYYDQTGKDATPYDLNDNSVVDFPDVSIMMFYWTGSFRK